MRIRTVTADEMRALDRWAIDTIGIPAACLMENAGRAVADEAVRMLRRCSSSRIVILCGVGNNGGDGLVAARHLFNKGLTPTIVLIGDPKRSSPETRMNWQAVKAIKLKVVHGKALPRVLKGAGLLIDAVFGVGLTREVAGVHRSMIEAVNAAKVPALSVDIPSGLEATTGQVLGVAVKARCTVTLAYPKKGLFLREGPRHVGRLVVADIGIPYRACGKEGR